MCIEFDVTDIIVGVVAGLISSLIWFIIDKLRRSRYVRVSIDSDLDDLFDSFSSISANISYQFYDQIISEFRHSRDKCAEVLQKLNSSDYIYRRKKFISTIIYNIQRSCSRALYLDVGYSGEEELRARCLEFYYIIKPHQSVNFITTMLFLKKVNNKHSLFEAYSVFENNDEYTKDSVYSTLTSCSFLEASYFYLEGNTLASGIQCKTFTLDQYKEYIRDELKIKMGHLFRYLVQNEEEK